VKDPPGIEQLTKLYTEEAVRVIRSASPGRPFFLYLAHRSPHVPLEPAPEFRGRSAGGLYGDVVEEMDWSVGEVMRALRETGHERDTLVVFLSDNGPWLSQGDQAGSAAPYRGGKNSPYEGGLRVPAIAWWPGRIPAGRTVSEPLMSLDLYPTVVAAAGGTLGTADRYYGTDILPLLAGSVTSLPGAGLDGSREMLGYYFASAVALRAGRWKYIAPGYWDLVPTLYDLLADPSETTDVYPARPEIVKIMAERFQLLTDEVARGAKQPKKGGREE
jgi:arylsulfatase A-like enzyme